MKKKSVEKKIQKFLEKKPITRIEKRVQKVIWESYQEHIEAGNVPRHSLNSAIMSRVAYEKPLQCWVIIELVTSSRKEERCFAVDLRSGREAKPKK